MIPSAQLLLTLCLSMTGHEIVFSAHSLSLLFDESFLTDLDVEMGGSTLELGATREFRFSLHSDLRFSRLSDSEALRVRRSYRVLRVC